MPEAAAVLGAGNMGTALAQVLAANGHAVRAWSIEADVLEEIAQRRENSKYLPGVKLHPAVEPVAGLAAAVDGAGLLFVSVPSGVVPALAQELGPLLKPGQVVVNVAKGLEAGTHRRMSEVIAAAAPALRDAVGSLGGPAIAVEMARGEPMGVVFAAPGGEARARVQAALQNDHLKVALTADLPGVEYCAALKNVYAIALGLCDGLGYGANTKAFVAAVALGEMASIVEALGGRGETVYGLAGLGDLLTTGYSEHSRNRTFGEKLAAGGDWRGFLRTHTVEGVAACRALWEAACAKGLRPPLLAALHGLLREDGPGAEGMRAFLRDFSY